MRKAAAVALYNVLMEEALSEEFFFFFLVVAQDDDVAIGIKFGLNWSYFLLIDNVKL